jgi:hypothetical protein
VPQWCDSRADESVEFFFLEKKFSHFHQWPVWARVTGEWPSGDEEACERKIGLHDGVELLPGGPFFVKLGQVFAVFLGWK